MKPAADSPPASTAVRVILAVSVGHLLNDTIQSLLPAIYPLLKTELNLTFAQIGLITLAFQLTASLLQPLVRRLHRSPAAAVLARDRDGVHARRRGCCCRSPGLSPRCSGRRPWSGSAHRCFIPRPRASPGWRRVAGTVSRNRSSKSAATPAARLALCSPRWFSRTPRSRASRGSSLCRWPAWCCWCASENGIAPNSPNITRAAARNARPPAPASAVTHHRHDHHPRAADLLEIFLHGQPRQLLHVLPHPQIQRLRPERAAAPLPVPCRRRRRHDYRRAHWRSHRTKIRHLGLILGVAPFTLTSCLTRIWFGPPRSPS